VSYTRPVLSWEARTRLHRLTGMADELLTTARRTGDEEVQRELDFLMGEVRMTLALDDPDAAAEFEHVVVGPKRGERAAEVRAAELAGWLKAALAVEAMSAQRAAQEATAPPPLRRKQTLGFKLRSPITRDSAEADTPEPS
jgi:hypothetical protein